MDHGMERQRHPGEPATAFAGESQARNRYTFAAATAKKKGLHLIEAVFLYTADQERPTPKCFIRICKMAGATAG